jgi:hypothetical protein
MVVRAVAIVVAALLPLLARAQPSQALAAARTMRYPPLRGAAHPEPQGLRGYGTAAAFAWGVGALFLGAGSDVQAPRRRLRHHGRPLRGAGRSVSVEPNSATNRRAALRRTFG